MHLPILSPSNASQSTKYLHIESGVSLQYDENPLFEGNKEIAKRSDREGALYNFIAHFENESSKKSDSLRKSLGVGSKPGAI